MKYKVFGKDEFKVKGLLKKLKKNSSHKDLSMFWHEYFAQVKFYMWNGWH